MLLSLEVFFTCIPSSISASFAGISESPLGILLKKLLRIRPLDIMRIMLLSLAPGIKHALVYQIPCERVKVLLIYLPEIKAREANRSAKWTKYDTMLGKNGDKNLEIS